MFPKGRQVQANQQGQVAESRRAARQAQVAAAAAASATTTALRGGGGRCIAAAEPGRGAGGERGRQWRGGGAEEGAVQAPRRLRLPRPRSLQAVRGVIRLPELLVIIFVIFSLLY